MGFILLAVLLASLMICAMRGQKDMRRRIAVQRDVPREELFPRHYKLFTQVERRLWEAVREHKWQSSWEQVRFRVGEPGFQIVRNYVGGIREDFRRGHRIWGQVISHCPEGKLFAQLEWGRVKIEFAYYRWCALLGFRFRTVGVSIKELRQFTEIVATLAYRVRTMLTALESSGNVEFVDSILRQS